MALDWGYEQHNGPEQWCKYYPDANGTQQSPIDVNTSSIMTDIELLRNPLTWSYTSDVCTTLQNTGKGWQVCVDANGCSLEGGPLQHHYKLQQFHCHWGENSKCGSEHTVNGQSFSGELHLVHWNADLFKSFKEAARSNAGLAVLGIFLQLGREHEELSKLTRIMKNVPCMGDTTPISEKVDPASFIPGDHSYWTYQGSLTTPPCYESVTWIVFKQPMEVSEEQLEEFRKLLSKSPEPENENKVPHDCILKNHRPPQPLHDRLIRFASPTCN